MKGFTLIELMIVVAAVGVLASVTLPAFQDRKNETLDSHEAVVIEIDENL